MSAKIIDTFNANGNTVVMCETDGEEIHCKKIKANGSFYDVLGCSKAYTLYTEDNIYGMIFEKGTVIPVGEFDVIE